MPWRLRSTAIPDAQGFGRPIDAIRLLVPPDWRPEGGVRWVASPVPSAMVQLQWRALAEDGRTGVEILPSFTWSWNDDPASNNLATRSAAMGQGAPVLPPMGFAAFVESVILPAHRPGARILEVLPDAAASRARAAQAAQGWAGIATVASDVATVRIALPGGIEERISGAVDDLQTAALSTSAAMRGAYGVPALSHQLSAQDIWVFRYPQGTWSAHQQLFATIARSSTPNPGWVAAVSQVMQGTARSLLDATIREAAAWRTRAHPAPVDRRTEPTDHALPPGEDTTPGYDEPGSDGDEYSDDSLFDPTLHDA